MRRPDFRLQGTIFHSTDVEVAFEEARAGGFEESEVESVFDRVFVEDLGPQVEMASGLEGSVTSQPVGDSFLVQFSLRRTLKPGLTVFRVVARDEQDRASNMKYAVLYQRPLNRSPWLYGGIVAALAVIAGAYYTRSVHRRNKLLKRRFNPYIAGAPVMQNHLFFGRDDQIYELLSRLRRRRFTAVVGSSGTGKSSLVRAGLLPALESGFMVEEPGGWRIAVMRPGENPIAALAAALIEAGMLGGASPPLPEDQPSVQAMLRRGSLGLVELAQRSPLPEGAKIFVLVDQFEELFRFIEESPYQTGSDEARAFIGLLLLDG